MAFQDSLQHIHRLDQEKERGDITAGLPDILREAAEKVRDFTGNGNGQRTLMAVGAAISFTCMVLGIRLSSPSSVR